MTTADVAGLVAGGELLALPFAFVAGAIAGLNPCCVGLYPAAAATCAAARGSSARTSFRSAMAFTAGMAGATAVLGVIAALAGHALGGLGGWFAYAVALVPIVMGMRVLGFLPLPLPDLRASHNRSGTWGALVTGALLALVVTPCGTPVLASVLSVAALRGRAAWGGVLLFSYGLGSALPLLAVGTAAGALASRMERLGWRRRVDQVTGIALIGVGLFLLWRA